MRRFVFVAMICAIASAAGGVSLDKGPYLLAVGDRWIVVKWEAAGSGGMVEYGFAPGAYEFSQPASAFEGMSEATLMCLKPGNYRYRVKVGSQFTEEFSFSTAPAPDEPFSFIVFGDNRAGTGTHQALIYYMIDEFPARLVVNTGDMVTFGGMEGEWDTWFNIERPLLANVPLYPVVGNHELAGGSYLFYKYFSTELNRTSVARYAYTFGNSRFIIFDSNDSVEPGSEQYEWLSQQLDFASKMPRIKHIFVSMHHPAFCSCHHASDDEVRDIQRYLAPLFEAYGVDIVFSGHCHFYERSENNGVVYVVTGAGGAPLYDCNEVPNDKQVVCVSEPHFCYVTVDGENVRVDVYSLSGLLIDSFSIVNDVGGAGVEGYDDPDPCYDYDYDGDGLTDGYEQYETDCLDPYNADTDGDGWNDGEEVNAGTDPCDDASHPAADEGGSSDAGCGCAF